MRCQGCDPVGDVGSGLGMLVRREVDSGWGCWFRVRDV